MESVHLFGTKLRESKIRIFYHGISIVMQFTSTVARFCSPTSTTVALSVAINFAKNGMILELENNDSYHMRFFDCSVLSDFSNEDERLFIQGGFHHSQSILSYTGLSFGSIRLLSLRQNLKLYVSVISRLQRFISGVDVRKPFANPKEQKLHKRCFQFLFNEKMNNDYQGDAGNQNIVPEYVQQIFDRLCSRTAATKKEMIIYVHEMVAPSLYLIFRETFCDVYSEAELALNREHRIQSVCGVKFDAIASLMPNLSAITLHTFPLSRQLMDSILALDWDGQWSQLRRIRIENAKDEHLSIDNRYRYHEVAAAYGMRFAVKSVVFVVESNRSIEMIRMSAGDEQQQQLQDDERVLLSPVAAGMLQKGITRWGTKVQR